MSALSDPVADYLTRIRNAQKARHPYVDVPASNLKRAITQILVDKGYVADYVNVEDNKQGLIRVYPREHCTALAKAAKTPWRIWQLKEQSRKLWPLFQIGPNVVRCEVAVLA